MAPVSKWTVEEEDAKQVPTTGLDDKRQMPALLTCSLSGELIPPKLI